MTHHDNLDDFEQQESGLDEPVHKPGLRGNLSNAWRSQPLFKLFVLMVVVGAIVAVSVALFSGNNSHSVANVGHTPELNEAPGGKGTSPYVKQQTMLANDKRTQDALNSGGSAVPTPIGQTADMGDMANPNNKSEPLNELRAEVDNMNRQLQQVRQAPPPQQQAEQFDDSLAQAMQKQMSQLSESWAPHGIKEVVVIKPEDAEREKKDAAAAATATSAAAATSTAPKVVVPAGTVSYAQLLTEANSDVPGPILAQIVSGPLAGARAVGQFQVANGTADYLVLQFQLADLKHKDYTINAIALDPDTTLGGMATEVDQRYFTRVILPAAAGFLQGLGSGLSQGSSSVISSNDATIVQNSRNGFHEGIYNGIAQGAQTASQFFQNQANQTKPLVRVAAGTPMGMFFISSVTEPVAGQTGQTATNGMPAYGAYPGYGQQQGYPGMQQGYGTTGQSNVPYPNYATSTSGYGTVSNGYTTNGYGTTGTTSAPSVVNYPGSTVYYGR